MSKFLILTSLFCLFFINNQPILAATLPKSNSQPQFEVLGKTKYPPQYFGQKMPFRDKILLAIAKKVLKKQQMPPVCSKIVKTNGEVLEVLIVSRDSSEVKYRPCEEPKSAYRTILTINIDYIQAADGAVIFKNKSAETITKAESVGAKPNKKMAVLSSILGIASILPFAFFGLFEGLSSLLLIVLLCFVFSILAICVSRKHLNRIHRNPEKYGGKTLTVLGLILGIFMFAFIIFGFFLTMYLLNQPD